MDKATARKFLLLHRPGTMDAQDSEIAQALRLLQDDRELATWFEDHCGAYLAIRSKLKQIEVPPNLKRDILIGATAPAPSESRRRLRLVLGAITILLSALALWFWFRPNPSTRNYAEFEDQMVRQVQRGYAMSLASTNVADIHQYLSTRHWPADFQLTEAMQDLPITGCAALRWRNVKVTLLCLGAGRLSNGRTGQLFLLVAPRAEFQNALAPGSRPRFSTIFHFTAVTWSEDQWVFVLASPLDGQTLRNYLRG